MRVGGGLSNEPHLAVRLNAFVLPEQAVAVVKSDHGDFPRSAGASRKPRSCAAEVSLHARKAGLRRRFLEEIETRLGYKLLPGVTENVPDETLRDHVGIHRQRQAGLSYVGASVLRGRLTRRAT